MASALEDVSLTLVNEVADNSETSTIGDFQTHIVAEEISTTFQSAPTEIDEGARRLPFSRIDISKVEFHHPILRDNRYNAGEEDYGAKASRDLIVTRGKAFRTEKGKKKKGSYRGGKITTEVASFKFE